MENLTAYCTKDAGILNFSYLITLSFFYLLNIEFAYPLKILTQLHIEFLQQPAST